MAFTHPGKSILKIYQMRNFNQERISISFNLYAELEVCHSLTTTVPQTTVHCELYHGLIYRAMKLSYKKQAW